jgi:hypothetical protein
MPTDRSLARWRSRKGLRIAALLAGVSLSAVAAHAQNATWNLNGNGDFNNSANWTPTTVPTGTAFFGGSNQNNVTINSLTTIGGWTFNAGAPVYNFNNQARLIFNGAGIVNNAGAAVNISNAGVMDLSGLTSAGMTVALISGGGTIFLGSKNLTATGPNNVSLMALTLSGSIQDGGANGGTGGSLTFGGGLSAPLGQRLFYQAATPIPAPLSLTAATRTWRLMVLSPSQAA